MYDFPHRRFNPLTGDWVLVSPQRTRRPWKGRIEKTSGESLPAFDPTCYLCPGNTRAGGVQNPSYTGVFAFDNDFSALVPKTGSIPGESHPLFQAQAELGICRVVCFSPRHDLTIPQLSVEQVAQVIAAWSEQTTDLCRMPGIRHVQVFENKGAIMGCSNPHPHSQIWAQGSIPNEPAKELGEQRDYLSRHDRPLLLDYVQEEQQRKERMVLSNEHFSAIVPFWAVWPFEVLITAHRPVPDLPSLTGEEIISLAEIYRQLAIRYDNLFEISFPYSMGFHQAPNDGQPHPEWVLHAHFYPPLLRSASIRKFMVGYEMLAMPQRDITPETSAERLRSLPDVHYQQTAD
ncbi:UTP-hexose-1-phosphate uridylyltransferase [Longilinea arvoryzae]|uniref:Galactose-1-phosphate uridylyltransferase n=1 Tax=Longilinea arvoryzae TaxID=360412 RepID=A0A0S7BAK3_9CHLR|nr:UDP-glucose--hexose-1-phosphate uridylyltransferase [Longilinea arvoryzae]GAP14494.1 UTP-hexose-1-phosphate uridylyltransferase [Longilinea arvoryzae]